MFEENKGEEFPPQRDYDGQFDPFCYSVVVKGTVVFEHESYDRVKAHYDRWVEKRPQMDIDLYAGEEPIKGTRLYKVTVGDTVVYEGDGSLANLAFKQWKDSARCSPSIAYHQFVKLIRKGDGLMAFYHTEVADFMDDQRY